MKSFKGRKFYLIILLIAGVLLCGIFFMFFCVQKQFEENVNAYAWSGSGTQSDPYIISGPVHLDRLAEDVSNGKTYSGKYFKLTQSFDYYKYDPDYGDTSDFFAGIGVKGSGSLAYNKDACVQYSFNGYFDGGGHTISGFEINGPIKSVLSDGNSNIVSSDMFLGFFAALGKNATVCNLRLKDFTLNIRYKGDEMSGYMSDPRMLVGGIAGGCIVDDYDSSYSKISIYNCAVEGMTVNQSYGNANVAYVGGITGGNTNTYSGSSLDVRNCYVADVSIKSNVGIYPMQNGGSDMVGAFVGYLKNGDGIIGACVLDGSNNQYIKAYANGNYPEKQTIGGYVYLTKDSSYDGLNWSSAGGKTGTTWYRHNDYNDGIPKLRGLMDWSECTITPENCEVDKTSIYLPSDAAKKYESNEASIRIYGQTITASQIGVHDSITWSANGIFSYTVRSQTPIRTLTFSKMNGVDLQYRVNSGAWTAATSSSLHNIKCGTNVTVSYTNYAIDAGVYKTCTFSFINTVGATVQVQYHFTTNGDYYISGNSLTNTSVALHQNETINVTLVLREYDLEIQ